MKCLTCGKKYVEYLDVPECPLDCCLVSESKDPLAERRKVEDAYFETSEGLRQGDMVNHPSHYTSHASGIECIDIVKHMNFCLGNAFKYIWRVDDKGDPIENLEKAKFYIEREIERRQK